MYPHPGIKIALPPASSDTDLSALPEEYTTLSAEERHNLFEYGLLPPRAPSPVHSHAHAHARPRDVEETLRQTRLALFHADMMQQRPAARSDLQSDDDESPFITSCLRASSAESIWTGAAGHVDRHMCEPPPYIPRWRCAVWMWHRRQEPRVIGTAAFCCMFLVACVAVACWLTVGNRRAAG